MNGAAAHQCSRALDRDERLSTSRKINSAADDAAGFAIAESMTAQIRGLSMAAKNASDGQRLLKVVENATNDVTDILRSVRELAVQAQKRHQQHNGQEQPTKRKLTPFSRKSISSEDTTYNNVAYLGSGAGDCKDPGRL